MKVSDVMSREVLTMTADTSLHKAAKLMLQYELSGFPVVELGKLIGIISEGDLMRRIELGTEHKTSAGAGGSAPSADDYARAHGTTVGEVMSRNVVTIAPDAPLADAVQLMERHHVKRLPVIKDGHLVGVISRGSLLRAFVVAHERSAPHP